MSDLRPRHRRVKRLSAKGTASIAVITVLLIIMAPQLALKTQASETPVSTEVLTLSFDNVSETLKHLDNTSEVYDGGTISGDVGASVLNGYLVFYGNNTGATSSTGYDEPIVVVKGYNETNGASSYAIMPYNYTVEVEFMTPSDPGHGNFFILPRYHDVDNKYEIAVDMDYGNIVFNRVRNGTWEELAVVQVGTLDKDVWYRLHVDVLWEYDPEYNAYVNHFHVELYNGSTLIKEVDFEDNDTTLELDPDHYYGLAFLGFTIDSEFRVYMDNLSIEANMLQLGEEPSESSVSPWGGSDLDVESFYAESSGSIMFLKLQLASAIGAGSQTEYWIIQLDVDKDSRASESGWQPDYSIIAQLASDGSAQANLFDSAGNWLGGLHILGGGIGYDYLVVEVNETLLSGLGNSLYLYAYTQNGTSVCDGFPRDDTGGSSVGDYLIWYLTRPSPASSWTTETDPPGDIGSEYPQYLDIVDIGSAFDTENLYLAVNVSGQLPWYGGSASGLLRIYVDADDNSSTGYQVGGIGADYMVEYVIGFSPRLWKYSGNGTSWNWTFVAREDYLYNPGGSTALEVLLPKGDFEDPPLSDNVQLVAQTGQDSSIVDTTEALPAPVPEPWFAVAGALALLALAALRARRGWRRTAF